MNLDSRPRERLLKFGIQNLSEGEILALMLRTGTRGKKGEKGENAIEMGERLIQQYGLDKLYQCSLKELQAIKGIGPAKAMQLLSIFELSKRVKLAEKPIKKITCAKDVFDLYHPRLKDEKQEHFIVLHLNTKNHIIGEEWISKGTLDAVIVEPREVFKSAIKNSASKIILVHNHPSGDSEPSQEDIELTKKIIENGKMLNIQALDHVIIAESRFWNWLETNF